MGEYAFRKSDKAEVKIGTCNSMYYLRWDNRKDIVYPYSLLDVSFRLPFPDEDNVRIGEYDVYDRSIPLVNYMPFTQLEHGNIWLHHISGMRVEVPCYHGCKASLAQNMKPTLVSVTHNNVSPSFHLMRVKHSCTYNKLCPVIKCAWCDYVYYSSTWQDILPFITDDILLNRLVKYAEIDLTNLNA